MVATLTQHFFQKLWSNTPRNAVSPHVSLWTPKTHGQAATDRADKAELWPQSCNIIRFWNSNHEGKLVLCSDRTISVSLANYHVFLSHQAQEVSSSSYSPHYWPGQSIYSRPVLCQYDYGSLLASLEDEGTEEELYLLSWMVSCLVEAVCHKAAVPAHHAAAAKALYTAATPAHHRAATSAQQEHQHTTKQQHQHSSNTSMPWSSIITHHSSNTSMPWSSTNLTGPDVSQGGNLWW